MINKQLLQKRFTKQAHIYDEFANIQRKMANRLLTLVNGGNPCDQGAVRILEIGCGTGYLTERLLHYFPRCQITAVDLAPGMIDMAKKRINDERVMFICGDAEELEFNDCYHIIISNATFQWFNKLEKTIKKFYETLTSGGRLYFSTFGNFTFHELHTSFQKAQERISPTKRYKLGQSFYSLNELATLCKSALRAYPIQIHYEEMHEVETFATVWDFLTSIKKIGANNSNQEDYCLNPSILKEMIRIYDCRYRIGNNIPATYHCLYFSIETP